MTGKSGGVRAVGVAVGVNVENGVDVEAGGLVAVIVGTINVVAGAHAARLAVNRLKPQSRPAA
jgi:hypothetical protein